MHHQAALDKLPLELFQAITTLLPKKDILSLRVASYRLNQFTVKDLVDYLPARPVVRFLLTPSGIRLFQGYATLLQIPQINVHAPAIEVYTFSPPPLKNIEHGKNSSAIWGWLKPDQIEKYDTMQREQSSFESSGKALDTLTEIFRNLATRTEVERLSLTVLQSGVFSDSAGYKHIVDELSLDQTLADRTWPVYSMHQPDEIKILHDQALFVTALNASGFERKIVHLQFPYRARGPRSEVLFEPSEDIWEKLDTSCIQQISITGLPAKTSTNPHLGPLEIYNGLLREASIEVLKVLNYHDIGDSCIKNPSFFSMSSQIGLPTYSNFRSLTLRGICFEEFAFSDFLLRHSHTLESISLTYIEVDEESFSWKNIFSSLQNLSALSTLYLKKLYQHRTPARRLPGHYRSHRSPQNDSGSTLTRQPPYNFIDLKGWHEVMGCLEFLEEDFTLRYWEFEDFRRRLGRARKKKLYAEVVFPRQDVDDGWIWKWDVKE